MVLMVSLQKQIYLILETKKMFYISRYPVPQFSLFFGFPKRKDSASALQQAKHGKNSTWFSGKYLQFLKNLFLKTFKPHIFITLRQLKKIAFTS